ncbi:MAG: zinc ribbon domain-containing protein, partial [Chloroflexi bacterium]|nr:zinc ribbon domain-containing protein [Chloroflexota bacterium]
VGSAFIWRQMARYLAGLIPVIGIVPKIVVSYSGTYVIGEAIYQWCANGEKLNPEELKVVYAEALERGSDAANVLIKKSDAAQHQAANKFKEIAQVISERSAITQEQASSGVKSAVSFIAEKSRDTRKQIVSIAGQFFKPAMACPACGKKVPKGAAFCAYCGKPLGA